MGLFGKKKNKKKSKGAAAQPPESSTTKQNGVSSPTVSIHSTGSGGFRRGNNKSPRNGDTTTTPETPTCEMVPQLVTELELAQETCGERPARALRQLFALSEHVAGEENRTKMVRVANARLVPVLLDFLQRCDRGSSEQYLTLLVLNNISIPTENKRMVALDCGGAQVFARLLCEDPSCHLMAIILVNLTFADAELRKELVSRDSDVELLESLAYTLRVSSLTEEEYDTRQLLVEADEDGKYSPRDLLQALMEEEKRLDASWNQSIDSKTRLPLDSANQLYPETARWCLSAIKNLTRPSKDSLAATNLVETGTVPLIMRFVAVPDDASNNNPPWSWHSNSMQDAALFVVMNVSATPSSREAVREAGGVEILSRIAEYSSRDVASLTVEEEKQLDLQCLKARMALAYLVGSEGYFGQPRARQNAPISPKQDDPGSVLLLNDKEVKLLVELLSNTLHERAKDGPGGYSAATFHIKWVLYAIRCLLTQTMNQLRFVKNGGIILNTLLIKALALHALQHVASVDDDAAEHAAFSLYLQSNYGFKTRFLPAFFNNKDNIHGTGTLASKILTSYIHKEGITPPGRHAADQLLSRLRYLAFKGPVSELVSPTGDGPTEEDFRFDDELLKAADSIMVEKRSHGAKPRSDIFDRSILRSRAPKKGHDASPWGNEAKVSSYPSALHAAQHLSFGSTKVRHMAAIDDVVIANNIATSANGDKTESYNYRWSWKNTASQIQKVRSVETSSLFSSGSSANKQTNQDDGPMSIFGFRCGPCA